MTENPFLDGYTHLSAFAKLIDHSERSVQRWVQRGEGPPITRIGNRPYVRNELGQEWLRSLEKKPQVEGRTVPKSRARKRQSGRARP